MLIPDVEAFPGHVACDSRSKSEIVVPVFDSKGAIQAILDVDSDQPDAFSGADQQGLERIMAMIYSCSSIAR
jgi:GAF domain-containing protein